MDTTEEHARTTEHVAGDDIAGVIARPPLLFLAALLLGFAADHLLVLPRLGPETGPGHTLGAVIAALLVPAGFALAASGVQNFLRAGTPVPTNEPTRSLVTTGVHGWTRNPIYLGLFAAYLGIGVAARSSWILVLAVPLAAVIRYGVVAREETYLERRFGQAYRDYKARVGRWL